MKVVNPDGAATSAELSEWWRANRSSSRVQLDEAFGEVLAAIAEHPRLGRMYRSDERYRLWRMKGTPYFLFYQIDKQADVVRVSAVWSGVRVVDRRFERATFPKASQRRASRTSVYRYSQRRCGSSYCGSSYLPE